MDLPGSHEGLVYLGAMFLCLPRSHVGLVYLGAM